jgi:predicted RecA/RadA family phage recombinase
MKNYLTPGEKLELTAPSGGVTAGTGVKIGEVLVIPETSAAVGEKFIGLRVGVVEHAKLSAQAWTEGAQVNWDDTNKRFTTVTTGNFKAGIAVAAAANPSATGKVLLTGVHLGSALA